MANQFQNITSGLAELKNFYQGPIVDQFNQDCNIYRGASKGKFNWSGFQVVRPLKVRRNPGIGATSDGGSLPKIGRQTTVQALIKAKYNYLRFGVTGPMIKASQNDVGSFVRSAAYELKEGYNDLRSDANRQMSWDGSGTLAQLSANASATTTISISGRESTEAALKFLDVGAAIDIVDSGGTVVASNVEVNSISSGTATSSTATIVLSAAVTASSGDTIIRSGSQDQEIQGLLTQLDGGTSTVFNVDRSTYLAAQGNVVDLGSGQLTLDAMQRAQDEAERLGGMGVSAIYTDYATRRMYQKLLTADKRYVNTVKGDGGFAAKDKNFLEFNGMPIVADKDCPTRMFFLNEKHIEKYVLAEMEFADETGSMYIAQTDNDQLEVRIRFFANLFNAKARGCAVISDYVSP
jgi:hypothetical protein